MRFAKASKTKSIGVLVLFLIIGAILGGALGELATIANTVPDVLTPFLARTFPIFDMLPMSIDLYAIKLVVGFSFYPNLASIFGMIIAAFIWYRISR